MPQSTPVDSAKQNKRHDHSLAASWTAADVERLIDLLYELQRTHGTNDNTARFKPQAWRIVSAELEKMLSKGGVKDARACKDKWKSLKAQFHTCRRLQKLPGFAWSPYHGCQASNMDQAAWKAWVDLKDNRPAVPYKSKPFPNWDKMVSICEGSAAGGEAAEAIIQAGGSYNELNIVGTSRSHGEMEAADAAGDPDDDLLESTSEEEVLGEIWDGTPGLERLAQQHPFATTSVFVSGAPNSSALTSSKLTAQASAVRSHQSTNPPANKCRCHTCTTAAVATRSIEATISALPNALAQALTPDPIGSTSRRKVLSDLAKEDWLLPQQKIALSGLFCKDASMCDLYIAWAEEPELRRTWMETLLPAAVAAPPAVAPIPAHVFNPSR